MLTAYWMAAVQVGRYWRCDEDGLPPFLKYPWIGLDLASTTQPGGAKGTETPDPPRLLNDIVEQIYDRRTQKGPQRC